MTLYRLKYEGFGEIFENAAVPLFEFELAIQVQKTHQHLVDAISLGSLYALGALGIGLIFGIMRLINFAHGDFISIGAYALIVPSASAVATMFIGSWSMPFMVVTIVLIVVCFALVSERILFRPLREANPATLLIGSFGLSFLIQHLIHSFLSSVPVFS